MTFRVNFYADQAFFSMVKRILKNSQHYDYDEKLDYEPEETATAIIISHSGCEAFLNIFAKYIEIENFETFERKSIIEKIGILYSILDEPLDWTRLPLQDIRTLDKLRNWLTHFKNSDIGLINSMGQWVVDDVNKKPKIDDGLELKYQRVERLYNNSRLALYELTKLFEVSSDFEYLQTEEYSSYLIG